MRILVAFLTVFSLSACASEVADERVGSDEAELGEVGGKADGVGDSYTYYSVRRDFRRCAYPMCGGYWVKRVNRSTTRCVDGRYASECYVVDIDSSAAGYNVDQAQNPVVVRGSISRQTINGSTWGQFDATEVWEAATSDADTSLTVYSIEDSGIRCITTPCFSLTRTKLNSGAEANLSELNLDGAGADQASVDQAWTDLYEEGILASGRTVTYGRGRSGRRFVASEFYLRRQEQACGSRGLGPCPDGYFCDWDSNANCGRADASGVCRAQPEACTREYAPVCGCDGQTYGNACTANAAGVSVEYDGECTVASDCEVGGCSGEICSEPGGPSVSICLWREEYACYQTLGVCERQGDGSCGWTPTPELLECIDNAS